MMSGHRAGIARLLALADPAMQTDEQLLACFIEGAEEASQAAFEALVVRHGPMVLGVCRQVLRDYHEAEDAFQATFLVLARKAASIRDRRTLRGWLNEVAIRIAARIRAEAARRRAHERREGGPAPALPEDEAAWNEFRPVIRDAVDRLPEKYRTPVRLCYLEGKTNEEVARSLRWPVGTVKGRLSRARHLLRARLARHGSMPAPAPR